MNKVLSISVALYNLENLISQNLESFVNSNCREDIEVLVTDDGSSDSSAEIVEKYQKTYPECIKLIKQKNAGPGSTVNSGIRNAIGKYFMMVDGDDWVDTNNLSELIEILKNIDSDMIITNYYEYSDQTQKIEKEVKFDFIEDNKIIEFQKIAEKLSLSMHATIYKTELFKKNNLVLDNCFYTDVEYVLLPIPYVNTIYYYDKAIYVYRVGRIGQSVNLNSMRKNIKMHDLVMRRMIEYFNDTMVQMNNEKKLFFANRLAEMVWTEIVVLLSFDNNSNKRLKIKELINFIKHECNDVYLLLKKYKKVKFLLYSNFLLVGLYSKIISKKYKV